MLVYFTVINVGRKFSGKLRDSSWCPLNTMCLWGPLNTGFNVQGSIYITYEWRVQT